MKLIRLMVPCAALLLAGGWYVGAAAPRRHFQAGLRALRAQDVEDVQYQLLAVEPSVKLEAQASLLRGWLLLQSKNTGDAGRLSAVLDELSDATDDEENLPLALALLGRTRYESGQLRDAFQLFEQSLRLDPDEVEAHRWVGIALYDIGLMRAAIPHLEAVARREPRNGRPHRLMGIIHRERGVVSGEALAFVQAAAAFQESLARDPAQPDADEIRVEMGRCFFYRNEYDEALAAVRPCFDSPDSLALRAECYYAKGEIDRARQCIDLALDQNPDDAHALSVKATLATLEGDVRQAAALLARAVNERPSDYDLRYRLVQVYRRLGDDARAEQHAEEMEKLQKLYEELQELTGRASSDLSDAGLRYRLAELAARLDMPESAASWLKAGQMLEAIELRRSLAQEPGVTGTPMTSHNNP